MKCEALLQAVAHTPWRQVYTTLHTGTKWHCKRQWKQLSQHQHTYRWEHITLSRRNVCVVHCLYCRLGCLRVSVSRFISQSSTNTTCSVDLHQLVSTIYPVCQPTYQAKETIAAASNSHLQSPPNHFPHPITQHPHRLLISEPTLREWTGKDWGV